MKLILLQGPSPSGKTETIKKVYSSLKGNNEEKVLHFEPFEKEGSNDFAAVVDYKGKQIAFYSCGAHKGLCISNIVRFAGADVLIMAENEKFEPILDDYNNKNFSYNKKTEKTPSRHVLIKKEKYPDNDKCKEIILEELNKII